MISELMLINRLNLTGEEITIGSIKTDVFSCFFFFIRYVLEEEFLIFVTIIAW